MSFSETLSPLTMSVWVNPADCTVRRHFSGETQYSSTSAVYSGLGAPELVMCAFKWKGAPPACVSLLCCTAFSTAWAMETTLSPASCAITGTTAGKETSTRHKSRQVLMLFFLRAWKESAALRARYRSCYKWAIPAPAGVRPHATIRYQRRQSRFPQSTLRQSFLPPHHHRPDRSCGARRSANPCCRGWPDERNKSY